MSTDYAKSTVSMDRAQRAWLIKMGGALKVQIDVTDVEDTPLTGVYGEAWKKKQSAGYEAESKVSKSEYGERSKKETKTEYGERSKKEKEVVRKGGPGYAEAGKKRKPLDGGHGGTGGEGEERNGEEEYDGGERNGSGYPAPGPKPIPEPTPEPTPAPYAGAAECAKYSKEVVKYGSKGPAVECLQKMLGGIAVDGKYGPGTQKAMQAWQKSHGLTPDGVCGPKTWAVLGGAPAGPAGYGEPGKPGYTPTKPGQPGYPPQKPGKPGYSPTPPGGGGYTPPPGKPGYPPQQPGKPGYPPEQPGQPGYPPYKPGEPGYTPTPPGGGGYTPPPGQPGYPPSKPGYPDKPEEPKYWQPEPCAPGHSTTPPDSSTPPKVVEDVSKDSGEKGVVQQLKDKAEAAKKKIEGLFE